MINKNLFFIPLLTLAVMSCSNDNEINSTKSEYVNSVRVTVEDFQPESSSTRTAYTVDGSGFHFQWTDGDALGIYPVGGDQVKFPISNGDGSASASFDGGAWKLRTEYQYAAYYPFSVDNYKIDQKALPVSFTGQTQNGDNSTAHLGAYDYLACAATAPDGSGGVDLTMKHLGAFLRLELTMPKADTYSSVVLESDGAEFVTAGTFDLTSATPAITPTATSSTYTINLTNVSTTEKNQIITVYTIVAPDDLSTSNIKVTVHGTGQTTYVQTVIGKNFAARSAYNIAVDNFPSGTNASGEDVSWDRGLTGTENGHDWVDLGLPSGILWATMNVGAANVTETGHYYAWGETTPKINTPYDFNNTKYCSYPNYYYYVSKYCLASAINHWNGTGEPDGLKQLLPEDDAACVNWGGKWKTPSIENFNELIEFCTFSIETYNNINLVKVTGPNSNSFYIANEGYKTYYQKDGTSEAFTGISYRYIYLTTSELDESGSYAAKYLCIIPYYSNQKYIISNVQFDSWERSFGIPVRAVCY